MQYFLGENSSLEIDKTKFITLNMTENNGRIWE